MVDLQSTALPLGYAAMVGGQSYIFIADRARLKRSINPVEAYVKRTGIRHGA